MTTTTDFFPVIDATKQDCITDAEAEFFRQNGLLIIRSVIAPLELEHLRRDTLALVNRAVAIAPDKQAYRAMMESGNPTVRVADPRRPQERDFLCRMHQEMDRVVPFNVQHVVDKASSCKVLMGHPFILRTVEKLQGRRNFVPTWDSVVFKLEGAGAVIPWHRDGDGFGDQKEAPIFNVDFYLDEADLSNCLWGIPGSHQWSSAEAKARIIALNEGGFGTDGAAPIPMRPGDVILHNTRTLHGSPAARSRLRRVVYFEYRPAESELAHGPHTPEYIPARQKVLLACLRDRARAPYVKGETPFAYRPDSKFAPPPFSPKHELPTYRVDHDQYWRANNDWKR